MSAVTTTSSQWTSALSPAEMCERITFPSGAELEANVIRILGMQCPSASNPLEQENLSKVWKSYQGALLEEQTMRAQVVALASTTTLKLINLGETNWDNKELFSGITTPAGEALVSLYHKIEGIKAECSALSEKINGFVTKGRPEQPVAPAAPAIPPHYPTASEEN